MYGRQDGLSSSLVVIHCEYSVDPLAPSPRLGETVLVEFWDQLPGTPYRTSSTPRSSHIFQVLRNVIHSDHVSHVVPKASEGGHPPRDSDEPAIFLLVSQLQLAQQPHEGESSEFRTTRLHPPLEVAIRHMVRREQWTLLAECDVE